MLHLTSVNRKVKKKMFLIINHDLIPTSSLNILSCFECKKALTDVQLGGEIEMK